MECEPCAGMVIHKKIKGQFFERLMFNTTTMEGDYPIILDIGEPTTDSVTLRIVDVAGGLHQLKAGA